MARVDSSQFTVKSWQRKRGVGLKEGKRRISTQSSQSSAENQGEENVRDEARGVAWFIEGVQ
jgi:hypothetical protein